MCVYVSMCMHVCVCLYVYAYVRMYVCLHVYRVCRRNQYAYHTLCLSYFSNMLYKLYTHMYPVCIPRIS